MKKLLMTGLAMIVTGQIYADIIAYWESNVNAPTWATNTLTVTSFKVGVVNDTTFGSTDGTFGTLLSPSASTALGAMKGQNGNTMSIRIQNDAATDLQLNTIYFDFSRAFGAVSPDVITVVYKNGNLNDATGTVVGSHTATTTPGKAGDYDDIAITLSSVLTDTILSTGQSATFEFQFSGGSTSASGLDNIAVDATSVIPEPATVGMLGLGTVLAVMLRRIRQ